MTERPLGVTVIAALALLAGALEILGGIVAILLGASFGAMGDFQGMGAFGAALGTAIGGSLIIGGLISLAIGWGLWNGKGWAWWLTVIFTALGAITSLIGILSAPVVSIIYLVIELVILWYFFKPHVKEYFGVNVSFST